MYFCLSRVFWHNEYSDLDNTATLRSIIFSLQSLALLHEHPQKVWPSQPSHMQNWQVWVQEDQVPQERRLPQSLGEVSWKEVHAFLAKESLLVQTQRPPIPVWITLCGLCQWAVFPSNMVLRPVQTVIQPTRRLANSQTVQKRMSSASSWSTLQ